MGLSQNPVVARAQVAAMRTKTGLGSLLSREPLPELITPEGVQIGTEPERLGIEGGIVYEKNGESNGNTGGGVNNEGSGIIEYKPTSGIEIKSNPDKVTTILGKYSEDIKYIIEEMGISKTTESLPEVGGFNLLNTPDECYKTAEQFWREYNKPFIDAAIERGDDIVMATPINNSTLYIPGTVELTGYGQEYFYLLNNGYVYINGKMILK